MSCFAGRSVVVTGGGSFIGSHLTEALVRAGARVAAVGTFSTGRGNLSAVADDVEIIIGDLRDYDVCRRAAQGRDIVFHLANKHGGRGFIESRRADICQNMIIDGNMLRASHESGVSRFCYASSACVYPTSSQVADTGRQARYLSEEMADPFTENAALADGEYGWAKLMGEMALAAYGRQYGMPGVSCRLFTVYGPRAKESHAVLAFIAKALLRQDPFEIWGTGEQDRNFTYVGDVVTGMMLAAERIEDCRAVNIGGDEIVKIRDAAQIVCDAVGHAPSAFFFDTSKPEGVQARAASVENQIAWLGWRPSVRFVDGARETVAWYRRHVDLDALRRDFAARLDAN